MNIGGIVTKMVYIFSVRIDKHSIASEAFCMNQVTFALQNIKIRLWQAVKILKGYWNFISRRLIWKGRTL